MRFGRKSLAVSIFGCAAMAGALVASPATAAKKTPAKPKIPKGAIGIQKAFEAELGRELNRVRRARKLKPLRGSRILKRAARGHTKHMAKKNRLTHTGRGGSIFWERFVKLGYAETARMSEIIAKRNVCRPGDPAIIIREWIASPRHRVLMFDRKIKYFGAAVVSKSGCSQTYYTLDFGS